MDDRILSIITSPDGHIFVRLYNGKFQVVICSCHPNFNVEDAPNLREASNVA